MEDSTARRRVAVARVGILGTTRPDGRPHLVPATFALAGDEVSMVVDAKPKRSMDLQRLRNIAAEPRVSLLVHGYDEDWSQLWWVRLDGVARIVHEGEERARAIELLASKYAQYREAAPPGPAVVVAVASWRSWTA